MSAVKTSSRNPWLFVPTLYFAEGLPYIVINTVSVILFKRLGVDNANIAFWTSWFYLPWVIKMFWGPIVDVYSSKRTWVLITQVLLAVSLFLLSIAVTTSMFFVLCLVIFIAGAFVSATHDIAADGFYMLGLSEKDQALFVGIRSGFYRLAMIFGSGALVFIAGIVEKKSGNIPGSWALVLGISGAIFLALALYHRYVLPYPLSDIKAPKEQHFKRGSFSEVIRSYFKQERVGGLIAFILLYRFGEAMLLKLVAPFLLDPRTEGGLALSTTQVGLAYGTVGILSLVFGGIIGGWLISRYGIQRCIWPMVLVMNLPDLLFVYMAHAQPSVYFVYPLVALEQFGYGVGFTAFTVTLMYTAEGKYQTSHYAISTGIMALGMMLPGFISGWLQEQVGYTTFFIIVCFLTIPGFLTIPFLLKRKLGSGLNI